MDLEETKALFYDLVRRGLLACQDESTTFLLTPWPAACGTMKPSALRPSRRLSLGRAPKTKAEPGKPACCRPPRADHQVRGAPAAATPCSATPSTVNGVAFLPLIELISSLKDTPPSNLLILAGLFFLLLSVAAPLMH